MGKFDAEAKRSAIMEESMKRVWSHHLYLEKDEPIILHQKVKTGGRLEDCQAVSRGDLVHSTAWAPLFLNRPAEMH